MLLWQGCWVTAWSWSPNSMITIPKKGSMLDRFENWESCNNLQFITRIKPTLDRRPAGVTVPAHDDRIYGTQDSDQRQCQVRRRLLLRFLTSTAGVSVHMWAADSVEVQRRNLKPIHRYTLRLGIRRGTRPSALVGMPICMSHKFN